MMVGGGVARKIASLQPPEKSGGPASLMETPRQAFARLPCTYGQRGMGLNEVFLNLFGQENRPAAEKAANFANSFSEPQLQSSMALSLITMHEYAKSADYALKLIDFCIETNNGKPGAQAACTGAHVARIAASVGETHFHNPSDTLDILFSFSNSECLRNEIVRIMMCLSRISSKTFEPRIFNNVLRATKLLAEVSPSNVRVFLTSMARLSDMGEHGAVNDASGSLIAIWVFRKGCVAYMPELMDALASRDVGGISRIACDLRALFCKFEPMQ